MHLPGFCSVVVSSNDNSCPYGLPCFCIVYSSPSLVCCAAVSRGYWEAIGSGAGGCYGAWLGCAGSTLFCAFWFPSQIILVIHLLESGARIKLEFLCLQLAGINRPIALAQANAVLNRIDLLCGVFDNLRIFYIFETLVCVIIFLFQAIIIICLLIIHRAWIIK